MLRMLSLLLLLAACTSQEVLIPTPTSGPQLSAPEAIAIVQTWLALRNYTATDGITRNCLDYHLRGDDFEARYTGNAWRVNRGDRFIWTVYEASRAVGLFGIAAAVG